MADDARDSAIRSISRPSRRTLENDHLLATARWILYRRDSVTASGPFTLVLRRDGDRSRIVHDRFSTDSN
jgi:hypothetical protein